MNTSQTSRFWLNYPPELITRPVVWELSQQFDVVFNVRQASVDADNGLVSLELTGARDQIKRAVAWLESIGVRVEPVEVGTIES